MPCRILLVEPDPQVSAALEGMLVDAGHHVAVVRTFEAAIEHAVRDQPDLLITAVRLGRFNGLHLAVRFRADYPDMAIIITGEGDDVGVAAEAIRHHARFVPLETPPGTFLAFVNDLTAGLTPKDLVPTRRWPRRPADLPAIIGQRAARVRNVSYGGVCLEQAGSPDGLGRHVTITLPSLAMELTGLLRQSHAPADGQPWLHGVELVATTTQAAQAWRMVVDSFPQP